MVNNKPAANRKKNVDKRRMIGSQATIVKLNHDNFIEDTFDQLCIAFSSNAHYHMANI